MDFSDVVLSEVHLCCEQLKNSDNKYVKSRFIFRKEPDSLSFIPSSEFYKDFKNSNNEKNDEDLDPPRNKKQEDVLLITHRLQTPLCEVGGQVWMASLFMADYVLDQSSRFLNQKVLELGVGVGLDAVAISMFASKVLCTDVLPESLELCKMNLNLNKHLDNHQEHVSSNGFNDEKNDIEAATYLYHKEKEEEKEKEKKKEKEKEEAEEEEEEDINDKCRYLILDWSKPLEQNIQSWKADDRDVLSSVDLIIASDVVYSEELTTGLLNTITQAVNYSNSNQVIVLIALEKRLNFTMSDADVACPAYNHFVELLQELCTFPQCYSSHFKFTVSKIENIPQSFVYQKSPYLEMWEIVSERINRNSSTG